MTRKFLLCIVAILVTLGLVVTGCGGGGGPQPVTIKMLIRNNDNRLLIGNYVKSQLEALGFTVTTQYGTGGQLAPIWQGDPKLGLWNVYTAAWQFTAVPLDEGGEFGNMYTPLGAGGPLWDAYTPTADFLSNATALYTNDFTTMAQREQLFNWTLPLSMQDSVRIFLDDRASFAPLDKDVDVAADAYGGLEGSSMWGHTICFVNTTTNQTLIPKWDGGSNILTMKIAEEDLLDQPWNPVAGTNWAFDMFAEGGTQDDGFEYDVRDGLVWPHIAEKADVVVESGLPIVQSGDSLGWLNLTTSPGAISVPSTAWADWNGTAWIPAGPGITAKTKTVVYYPTGTFNRPLQDGSNLSAADFLLYAIMYFDRAKTTSGENIYDASWVPIYDAFMTHFKGVVFNVSVPGYDLVVTTYDDMVTLNAELIAMGNSWFPNLHTSGGRESLFDNVALGILAEKNGSSAFSDSKATSASVEWMSFIAGPSLVGGGPHSTKGLVQYLSNNVLNAASPDYGYVPYSSFLGAYINQTQAVARYQNLQNFYTANGNVWVETGPYYLKHVDTTAKTLELDAFTSYLDSGSQFFFMMDPMPTDSTGHLGAYCDKVTLEMVADHTAAVTRLMSGGSDHLDVYAAGLSDATLKATCDANPDKVHYYLFVGLFDELTFNPSGPFFPATGKLNPFAIPAIREALNKVVDRSLSPDVITNLQMEELAKKGKILRPSDARARAVAFIQCAGSRDPDHLPYCSDFCCLGSLKQALYVRQQNPEALAYILYKDIRTPGQSELFYKEVQSDPGVLLTKAEVTGVSLGEGGKLLVSATETLLGDNVALEADLVVLATGVVPVTLDRPILNLDYRQGPDCRRPRITTALRTPTSSASRMKPGAPRSTPRAACGSP